MPNFYPSFESFRAAVLGLGRVPSTQAFAEVMCTGPSNQKAYYRLMSKGGLHRHWYTVSKFYLIDTEKNMLIRVPENAEIAIRNADLFIAGVEIVDPGKVDVEPMKPYDTR